MTMSPTVVPSARDSLSVKDFKPGADRMFFVGKQSRVSQR